MQFAIELCTDFYNLKNMVVQGTGQEQRAKYGGVGDRSTQKYGGVGDRPIFGCENMVV
jgi:hypothetical protein